MPHPSELLQSLGRSLANNHVALSVPTEPDFKARERLLKEDGNSENQSRIVVVVGAGASRAGAELPSGDEAAAWLQQRLGIQPEFFEYELERLSTQYRLSPEDFETKLLALSKFHQPRLLDELYKMFARQYHPTLTYEVLAHLLKHRFIDAIVSFNFDELLDQSVDDELGTGNYYKIISDGDYPDDIKRIMDDNGRFRRPLYIKPHGTASRKSTMRFTREAYFMLPEDIKTLLMTLLSGLPTVLLVIGYKMQSVEFNHIIESKESSVSEIFSIDIERLKLEGKLKALHGDRFIEVSSGYTLDEVTKDLWKAVRESFNGEHWTREIVRHELICQLFSEPVDITKPESARRDELKSYLRDRTYVELALCIAKAKGFVHLNQLSGSRAGRYFELYKYESDNQNESLLDFCQKMNLKGVDYSPETLRLGSSTKARAGETLILERDRFIEECPNLFKSTSQSLTYLRRPRLRKQQETFKQVLMSMYDGEEVEVEPSKRSNHYRFFSAPIILRTLTSLKVHTLDLLAKDWDLMLSVAESGQWLLSNTEVESAFDCDHRRRMVLIVADNTYRRELIERFGEQLVAIVVLPWWLHNQHLTVFMQDRASVRGIFFERRLRASSISPVGLTETDSKVVENTFFAYWVKALRYTNDQSIGFVSGEDVARERAALLQRVYSKAATER